MRFGSVCSGIEAASQAWEPLGWDPVFFSEIDPFPRAVLNHHYPDVPCHGDFTTIEENTYGAIDLLVGGTPCQSFSVAGLRKGMDDERGNLALEYLRLVDRLNPRGIVWENVPGVLSSNGGRDFGSFLGGLVELGYGFAYRILDAQYFGVPQRRRRVFVVGYLGDWRPAAAVLFERESLRGHTAPSRGKEENPADRTISCLAESSGKARPGDNIQSVDYLHPAHCPDIANPLTARMAKGINSKLDEGQTPIAIHGTQDPDVLDNMAHPLGRNNGQENAVSFAQNQRGELRTSDVVPALNTGGGKPGEGYPAVTQSMAVRRLTPTECERLQGFPDNHTRIPWRNKKLEDCPDGPRYKALGNSMAVPVMRWIGERIQLVQDELEAIKAIDIVAGMNCGTKDTV